MLTVLYEEVGFRQAGARLKRLTDREAEPGGYDWPDGDVLLARGSGRPRALRGQPRRRASAGGSWWLPGRRRTGGGVAGPRTGVRARDDGLRPVEGWRMRSAGAGCLASDSLVGASPGCGRASRDLRWAGGGDGCAAKNREGVGGCPQVYCGAGNPFGSGLVGGLARGRCPRIATPGGVGWAAEPAGACRCRLRGVSVRS